MLQKLDREKSLQGHLKCCVYFIFNYICLIHLQLVSMMKQFLKALNLV